MIPIGVGYGKLGEKNLLMLFLWHLFYNFTGKIQLEIVMGKVFKQNFFSHRDYAL